MIQQGDQDPRLERQMKYAKDLSDASNVNRTIRRWYTYAYREISLGNDPQLKVALNYTPGDNWSELLPDIPLPKKTIKIDEIAVPEEIQDHTIMTPQEVQQLRDFLDYKVAAPEQIYQALGLTPQTTNRELLVKATQARYNLDPGSAQ